MTYIFFKLTYIVPNKKATMFGIPIHQCSCIRARTRVGRGARGPADVFVMGFQLSRWKPTATLSAAAPPWERALAVTLMACATHLARFACLPNASGANLCASDKGLLRNAESRFPLAEQCWSFDCTAATQHYARGRLKVGAELIYAVLNVLTKAPFD